METTNHDYKSIPGWGMDIDPENEPTYPMKNWTGDDHKRINYERSIQQPVTVELLKSNERPAPSVVFGTTVPPSGLSGIIRRYAFQHSEDRYRHWLPLILADRINMIEGVCDDISAGHWPNMIKERGWAMEWKYNKVKFVSKLAINTLAAAAIISVLCRKKRK